MALFRPMKALWSGILSDFKAIYNDAVVSKDKFPRLLRKLMNELKSKRQSLVSGFRKCGIYPFDPRQVLNRMPKNVVVNNNETDVCDTSSVLGESFLAFLSKKRYGEEDGKKPKRTKVNVEPGKSVGVEDLIVDENENSKEQKKKKKGKGKKKRDEVEVDEDDVELVCNDNETSCDKDVIDVEGELKQFGYKVDCHVIVEYEGEYFPGVVKNVDVDGSAEVSVMVMRGKDWAWPEKPDQIWYNADKIVMIIDPPQLKPSTSTSRSKIYSVSEMSNFRKF